MSHGEQFLGCTQDVFNANAAPSDFCTRENWQSAVLYLAGELETLGLPSPCTKADGEEELQSSLDVIALVNSAWRLVQLYRSSKKTIVDLETLVRRTASDRDRLMASAAKQRDTIQQRERLVAESSEKERQASEQMETGNQKLKGAKEEVRRLMSVLLQRESKYSHEIRRAEQENAKLKERLLKVLVEKGEGKGIGWGIEVVPGARGGTQRGKWGTDPSNTREEEVFAKVLEELTKKDDLQKQTIAVLRECLCSILESLQDLLRDLCIEFQPVFPPLDLDSTLLMERVRSIVDLVRECLQGCRPAQDVQLLQDKLGLYEEKLVLYEQMMKSIEGGKHLETFDMLSLDSLDRIRLELDRERKLLRKEREDLDKAHAEVETGKERLLLAGMGAEEAGEGVPGILLLPRQTVEQPPAWALGPVTVTPNTIRSPEDGTGAVLGYSTSTSSRPVSRPASRPGSRPGSQPGSRAPSLSRDPNKQVKGRSPAASLINRRNSRQPDNPSNNSTINRRSECRSSINRKSRPKSANISPVRGARRDIVSPISSYRQKSSGVSRSPSSSRESAANIVLERQKAYTRSLPRSQLNLNKRGSGVWSKPPTPGPYSPTTSDTGE